MPKKKTLPSSFVEDAVKVGGILQANKKKNFVQRIIEKDKWPSLPAENGGVMTHLMSWDQLGPTPKDRPIVYPEIVYDEGSKGLRRLGRAEAKDHAVKTGEYIEFDDPETADWFSKRYKAYWGE
jgi:hypothetical protein